MVLSEAASPGVNSIPKPPLHQQLLNSVPVAVAIYIIVVGLIVYGSFTGGAEHGLQLAMVPRTSIPLQLHG